MISLARAELGWLAFMTAMAAGATFRSSVLACERISASFSLTKLSSTAYSAESVLIEIILIVGPMIVALLVAFAAPFAAVYFAAASGFAGTLLFLRAPAFRN